MARARTSSENGAPRRRGARATGIVAIFGLALALAATGCYDPLLADGHYTCTTNEQCPPGFFCAPACQRCYHDTAAGKQLASACTMDVSGDAGGSGEGTGGNHAGGAGGGGGQIGTGDGSVVGGAGGAIGTAGGSGSGGAMVGSGGHGGTIVGGSGGTPGGAGGMNGAAGAMGTAGHVGTGGTSGGAGRTGSGGAMMGTGGTMGVGGKAGTGGAMMGVGGAMMGTGGAPGFGVGSPCSVGTQCASGFCVDGFCCNVACAEQCQACDVAPSRGTCSPVPSGPPHGTRAACAGSGTCGAQCKLITPSAAACVFASSTVSCAPQTCTGNTLTPARVCDGIGACAPATPGACPLGLSCNAAQSGCLASCTTSADCSAAAPNCNPSTHQCTPARPIGASCSVATDCQNGTCVDGFCCDSACNGACQACDVAGLEGHCTPLNAGQPHGQRGACGSPSDPCGGQCMGGNAMGCTFPSGNACSCPGVSVGGSCNGAGGCQTLLNLCLL